MVEWVPIYLIPIEFCERGYPPCFSSNKNILGCLFFFLHHREMSTTRSTHNLKLDACSDVSYFRSDDDYSQR